MNRFALLAVCLSARLCFAQGDSTIDVEALKAKYEQGLAVIRTDSDKALTNSVQGYADALKTLAQKLQGAGDLDGVLAVQKEQERFGKEKAIPESAVVADCVALKELQVKWLKMPETIEIGKSRKIVTLSRSHIAALEEAKKQLTVRGKLAEAVEVKNEIERVKTSAEVTAAEFVLANAGIDLTPKTNAVPKVVVSGRTGSPAGLRSSLVLHYSFDKDEKGLGKNDKVKVTDKSAKKNDGEAKGAKWTSRGKVGGAYEFNGKGDHISVPDGPQFDFGTSDFTMSAWIYPKEDSQNVIIGKSIANDRGYFFLQADKDRLQFLAGAGGDWSVMTLSSAGLALNDWNHVVVSQSSGRIFFWINGVSKGGGTGGTVNGDSTSLLIGGSSWGNLDFKGMIDEVMIFDRALTEKEVKSIYDAQK